MPDPGSAPDEMIVDATGRWLSVLYVPIELPPSDNSSYFRMRRTMLGRASPSTVSVEESAISPTSLGERSFYTEFDDLADEMARFLENSSKEPTCRQVNEANTDANESEKINKKVLRAKNSRMSLSSLLGYDSDSIAASGHKRKWSFPRAFMKSKPKSEDLQALFADSKDNASTRENVRPSDDVARGRTGQTAQELAEVADYLRHGPNGDKIVMDQPKQAPYYSPVSGTTRRTSLEIRPIQPVLPRNISDASKSSAATKASNLTSPSLSYSVDSTSSYKDARSSVETPSDQRSYYTSDHFSDCASGIEDNQSSSHVAFQPTVFPKYFNFDEIVGVSHRNRYIGQCAADIVLNETEQMARTVKPLGCLRDEVAGEMAWRDEVVTELGYLGSIVI